MAVLLVAVFFGSWKVPLLTSVIAVVLFWLWSPRKLRRSPRSLSQVEMDQLTSFLRENLGYITQKEMGFCDDYDPPFSAKLRTAFGNADWGIRIFGSPHQLKEHKGIWIFGTYQWEIQLAFEVINIAANLGDADGDNVIFCGD